MGRRGSGEVVEKILDVLTANPHGMTIQEISKKSGVNWDSTKRHLELFTKLGVLRENTENEKITYQKVRSFESDTLFSIPLSNEHKEIIRKIYSSIEKVWKTVSSKSITKTLVQKIAADVVEQRYPEIPRGWYLYGEILLLPYDMDQQYGTGLDKIEDIDAVKEFCTEYSQCCDTSYQIRKHQYEKRKRELYLIKDKLYFQLSYLDFKDGISKNKIRQTINQFAILCERKESNAPILAVVDDFCSETLSIFRNADNSIIEKSKPSVIEAFNSVWQLVGTYELYDSLIKFYDKALLAEYLFEKIKVLQGMSIESLENLHEFEFSVNSPDEDVSKMIKSFMGSSKEMTPEQKVSREKELQKMNQSDILRKFGFNDM